MQKKTVFFGAIVSVIVLVLGALYFTGNPLVFRLLTLLFKPTTVTVICFLLFYILWYTHQFDHYLKKNPALTTASTTLRASHVWLAGYAHTITGLVWHYVKKTRTLLSVSIRWCVQMFQENKKVRLGTYALVGAIVLSVAGMYVWNITRPVYLTPRDLADGYMLVRDAVPADGPIILKLPDGVDKRGARALVQFDPDIKVGYARTLSDQHIAFKLKEELLVGDHYTVRFGTPEEGEESATFKAVLRPQVEIFKPDTDIVHDEYSTISFLFNRAMIPLESLDREYDPASFPVSIEPETAGTFVWASPQQLLFVPDTHLVRSASYRVSIGDEFYSVDGLQVPPQEYLFSVKPLRLTSDGVRSAAYKEPVRLRFNQPIDLSRSTVTVYVHGDNNTKEAVPVTVEHASRVTYNAETEEKERIIDRSTIEITPVHDNLARVNVWDLDADFSYHIDAVYPLHGDIHIDEPIERFFDTPSFLTATRVTSPYSTQVQKNLFDPRGTMVFTFLEDIDLTRTKVQSKGVDRVSHALRKKCELGGDGESVCKQVPNPRTLEVHFDALAFDTNETFVVSLESVVGINGELFINEPIETTLTTVPDLEVTSLMSFGGTEEADLTGVFACSNVPLAMVPDEELSTYIQSAPHVEVRTWNRSIKQVVKKDYDKTRNCREGEYKTNMYLALKAQTSYTMSFIFKDQFSGRVEKNISFTTRELPKVVDTTSINNKEGSEEEEEEDDDEEDEDGGGFSIVPEFLKPAPLDFYNLHQRYSTTLPGRTTYTLWTENFEEIEVAICKLSPVQFIELGGRLSYTARGPTNCLEQKTATIDLPDTKHESHYFQVNLADYFADTRGQYVMTFTHPEYTTTKRVDGKEQKVQKYEHIYTSVTNLSLVQKNTNRVDLKNDNTRKVYKTDLLDKEDAAANLYWVVDLRTMDVVPDADVFVYQRETVERDNSARDVVLVGSARTDSDGIARTSIIPDVTGAYVVHGSDAAVVAAWSDVVTHGSTAREIERVYLYTDRPLYRPGHEVFIKGIHRIGYDGDFDFVEGEWVDVKVQDSRGATMYEETVTLSEYGTFDIALTLPEDAPLGTYRIRAGAGYASFDVEEYARSPFEVTMSPLQEEYISGDTMEVQIDARYFFGVAVPSGTVSYTITSQDFYFDRYTGEGLYNFNSGAYRCYYCNTHDQFFSRGTLELQDGIARLRQEIDFQSLENNDKDGHKEDVRSKIFVVRASVKDARGKSISAQTSFIVHKADFYAALKSDERFVRENTQVPLYVKTVDRDGAVVPVNNLHLTVSRKAWQKNKRQEVDGEFYYTWEQTEETVHDSMLSTNANGDATQLVTYPEAGEYSIALSGVDGRGNSVYVTSAAYVYGTGTAPVRPTNDRTLELSVEKDDLDVGEQTKVIIQSPYARAKALVSIERGTVITYDVIDVNSSYFDYDFTVEEDFIPNVTFTTLLVSNEPEIKYGSIDFNIDRKKKGLVMSVVSDKKSYIPGEEVVLEVRTYNREAVPVQAEVSLAAVDMSVLALKGNPTRDLLEYFYRGLPHEVMTSSNLKHVHTEIEIPTGTKGGGGGEDLEKKKRGIFKDTAFWDASVVTNERGYARVTFTLPDNLTKWRVESIAVTKDTKVGTHYLEFTEKKRLMTIPSVPRFIVPGDVFSIGAQVLNQSGTMQTADISIESETLVPVGPTSVRRTLADGANELVYFKVQAPFEKETGEHLVTIQAENNALADIVDKSIPIVRTNVKEVVRLSDFTDGETALEKVVTPTGIYEELGGISVAVHATVGAFVEDALTYMTEFPYGCSEQLASKLDTLATVRTLLALENVGDDFAVGTIERAGKTYTMDDAIADGLARIYEAQNSDGGFGYYKRLESDVDLSLHVVRTLHSLKEAGFSVSETRITRAIDFVDSKATRFTGRDFGEEPGVWNLERALAKTESLYDAQPQSKQVKNGILTIRDNLTKKTVKRISSLALAQAAILSDEIGWWDRRTVWKEVARRLKQDSDGMYLGVDSHRISRYAYETSIKNTSYLLRAAMRHDSLRKERTEMLAWLLAQRHGDGAWGSTNATHAVVKAIAEYIVLKDEQHAAYTLDVSIDDLMVVQYDTTRSNTLGGASTTVSFADLGLGTPHTVQFEKTALREQRDTFYYDIEMEYFLDRDSIPARSEGVDVTRNFYAFSDVRRENPVQEAELGDVLVGKVSFSFSKPLVLFAVEDIIPAGFELINFDYVTEDKTLLNQLALEEAEKLQEQKPDVQAFMKTQAFKDMKEVEVYRYEKYAPRISYTSNWRRYHPSFEELHDDRVFLFSRDIEPGHYTYEYFVRAQVPGEFQHMPATVSELYNPTFFGRTQSTMFTIHPKDTSL